MIYPFRAEIRAKYALAGKESFAGYLTKGPSLEAW